MSFRPAPGCKSYLGSGQHGLLSSRWGPFGASFFVSSGGKITVWAERGCQKYLGSSQNAVTSADWGAYPTGSFTFRTLRPEDCPQLQGPSLDFESPGRE